MVQSSYAVEEKKNDSTKNSPSDAIGNKLTPNEGSPASVANDPNIKSSEVKLNDPQQTSPSHEMKSQTATSSIAQVSVPITPITPATPAMTPGDANKRKSKIVVPPGKGNHLAKLREMTAIANDGGK